MSSWVNTLDGSLCDCVIRLKTKTQNVYINIKRYYNIMTPLESRRLSFKDHNYDTTNKSFGFRRSTSRCNFQESSRKSMTYGNNVDDRIRRESSFHKKKVADCKKLFETP